MIVRSRIVLAVVLALAPAGCRKGPPGGTIVPDAGGEASAEQGDPAKAAAPAGEQRVRVAEIEAHIRFLADDARGGRAPGSDGDKHSQDHIEKAMKAAGLEAGFGGTFRQSFDVTDGVRVRTGEKTVLEVGGTAVPHALVPFSADTKARGPLEGKLVFVGHGIARGGKHTGDYERIGKKLEGAIAVALAGAPDDPHLSPAERRPQSRLIAARDHGAVGFVWWDPQGDGYPNHGEAPDLGVPAVYVGKDGSAALSAALSGRAPKEGTAPPKPGTTSKRPAKLHVPVERVVLQTANVGGMLRGSGEGGRTIVVGAHMDHLGTGTESSLAPGSREIHNGADDNASGVAAMLETCRALATVPVAQRPFDVLCLAFGAEEMGLLGSKHFVRTLDAASKKKIGAMINFDMVGRLREDGVVVAGAGTSKAWADVLEAARGDLKLRPTDDGYGPSDHGSFYEVGIPVLHFFTGAHEDYHKPSDDVDKIDFAGAAKIADVATAIVRKLLAESIVPDYVEVARTTARGGAFRVSLGTIPDYGAQVDGVRLSDVRKGGAADKAGMRKGDVIQKIGEREVHNIDDYMAAFGEMKPGVGVQVVVEREGKAVELALVPAAPK